MKIGIVQPYFIPYIGYFQLINAVNRFVFYDDVNYIKRGWINRNNILVNQNQKNLITIPCENASQNKLINQISISLDEKTKSKILRTFELAYKKAPNFEYVFPLIQNILIFNEKNLAKFTANSIIEISNYIGITTEFIYSSENYSQTKDLGKADRLIEITKLENAEEYINPIGGTKLYSKEYFSKKNVKLHFLKSDEKLSYKQFNNDFIPYLSMIDVLMFNDLETINLLLQKYKLI